MEYKFRCSREEYESYLKVAVGLLKQKSFLTGKMKLALILFYIGMNMLIGVLEIGILTKISIILGAILLILIFAVTSKSVLLKNTKLIATLYTKKFEKQIYEEKTIEVKNDEVIYTSSKSRFTTKLSDIKEVVEDKNIIALISTYNNLCAFVPISVFKHIKEKEEFLQKINDKNIELNSSEEEMDYTYNITIKDYANYLSVYNSHIKYTKTLNKFMQISTFIIVIVFVPYYSIKYEFIAGVIFFIGIIIIYGIYLYFTRIKNLEKDLIKESNKYLKKNPELLETQQIKVEEDSVIHILNRLKKKYELSTIKKVYLKNDTIVVIGNLNILYFMVPCSVFNDIKERDEFIKFLSTKAF